MPFLLSFPNLDKIIVPDIISVPSSMLIRNLFLYELVNNFVARFKFKSLDYLCDLSYCDLFESIDDKPNLNNPMLKVANSTPVLEISIHSPLTIYNYSEIPILFEFEYFSIHFNIFLILRHSIESVIVEATPFVDKVTPISCFQVIERVFKIGFNNMWCTVPAIDKNTNLSIFELNIIDLYYFLRQISIYFIG